MAGSGGGGSSARSKFSRSSSRRGTAASRFPALSKGSKPFARGTPQAKAIASANPRTRVRRRLQESISRSPAR